jgi:hypothetical protein
MTKLYQSIARSFDAMQTCAKSGNVEWENKHADTIIAQVQKYLPSGSGIDCGVKFSFEKSHTDKLVFTFEYHAMNESGYYDGWYDYTLIVKPSLAFDFDMTLQGKDYNGCKDYLIDIFSDALSIEVESYIG